MHQVIHLLLVLGHGKLGTQLYHLALGRGDVVHQLAGHLAHLVAVILGQLVGVLQVGLLCGQLALGIQELSGVIVIAGQYSLLGITVILRNFLAVGVDAAGCGHFIRNNGGGFRLQLFQVGAGVIQILFQQLSGILLLGAGKQAVDVRTHDVSKSLQNTHYCSS